MATKRKAQHRARRAEPVRDWTPVRRGNIYCSPACGGGAATCTVDRYERSVDAADAAVRDLGSGWKADVFENLGWHARVVSPCGRLSISLPNSRRDVYTAFLGPAELQPAGKWAEHGRTAREAIERVLVAARHDLGLIENVVSGLAVPVMQRVRRPRRLKAG